jgi:hypothetical protein
MKKTIALLFLVSLCAATSSAAERSPQRITNEQARALVMASLSEQQGRLPKVEAEQFDAPYPSKFLFFTVSWEGTPKGSVVVGNYAVDPFTGDVFSAVIECKEENNKRLLALQKQVRATLHLSQSEYQRLKTHGPLCGK